MNEHTSGAGAHGDRNRWEELERFFSPESRSEQAELVTDGAALLEDVQAFAARAHDLLRVGHTDHGPALPYQIIEAIDTTSGPLTRTILDLMSALEWALEGGDGTPAFLRDSTELRAAS